MFDWDIASKLQKGCVIPAHPLALTAEKNLDERRQEALTRYYLAAGAGGVAVGVHTTQFAIHDPKIGLYQPVLELAADTAKRCAEDQGGRPIMIAGIVGTTKQAVAEAELAKDLGYDLGLLSLKALRGRSVDELIEHARQVGQVIPLMGFYLQQAISGMVLGPEFWERFAAIPAVCAIKIAPFNRYHTMDVLEAVARTGRAGDIALYTGNDDNIIADLLTPHEFNVDGRRVTLRIVGGLLGQWACWTKRAVNLLERIKRVRETAEPIPQDLLITAGQLTLANRAIFDADNNFAGCIPGISYVLKTRGLLANTLALDPADRLSPGQTDKIDQVMRNYPHLTDDDFVTANIDAWQSS